MKTVESEALNKYKSQNRDNTRLKQRCIFIQRGVESGGVHEIHSKIVRGYKTAQSLFN